MTNNAQRGDEALATLDKAIKSRYRKKKIGPLSVVAIALVIIVAIVGAIWFATTRNSDSTEAAKDKDSTATSTSETPEFTPLAMVRETPLAETVSCKYEADGREANGATAPSTENISARGKVKINFDTTQGPIGMELDREVAPCTVNAVEHLAKSGYYDNSICHRLTTSGIFVLQCGDPTGSGAGGPGFQFANEYPTDEATDTNTPAIYPRGSIAMANAGPDTNGSQFFLNFQDSPLPPLYTYFGQIDDSGLKTLDKIAEAGAKDGAPDGAPANEVKITKVAVK
ncbi:peptidylprolyl isomerase [Corynebacterium caspium]|uniref:peptidylprolyl isomerase n=1 Tax=Corynebacterium caspium TaxID=234828 RepID=UPI00037FCC2E|nr:peptidylprolyl isomerase [Corynebacterium caspium]WKD59184.1 Putative bifunctional phosphatase/peptidyl-prolyl cis-trans isomerase [Corynebacterium caspium DSM 44850]